MVLVLLVGSKTRRITVSTLCKIQTFINNRLHKILSSGQRRSAKRTFGIGGQQTRNKWPHIYIELFRRKWGWIGHTFSSRPAVSPSRLWPGIQRARERGEDPGTYCTETPSQKCIKAVTAGRSWKRQPRVGCAGGVLLIACAPHGQSKEGISSLLLFHFTLLWSRF